MTPAKDQKLRALEEAAQITAWEREGHTDRCGFHQESLPRIAHALAAGQGLDDGDANVRRELEQCPVCREVLTQTTDLLQHGELAPAAPDAAQPTRSYRWIAALAAVLLAGLVGVVLVHNHRSATKKPRSGRTDAVVQPRRISAKRLPRPSGAPPARTMRTPVVSDARADRLLERRARNLCEQGYILRAVDPEKAREYWRRVLALVPTSSKWAQKATHYLKQLEPRAAAGTAKGMTSDPPSAEPPVTPRPESPATKLYNKARYAWLAGRCGDAIRLARKANRLKFATRHVSIIGACACSLRRTSLARWAYRKLRGGQRSMLVYICRSKGIELP